jgi:hypothetical protein
MRGMAWTGRSNSSDTVEEASSEYQAGTGFGGEGENHSELGEKNGNGAQAGEAGFYVGGAGVREWLGFRLTYGDMCRGRITEWKSGAARKQWGAFRPRPGTSFTGIPSDPLFHRR